LTIVLVGLPRVSFLCLPFVPYSALLHWLTAVPVVTSRHSVSIATDGSIVGTAFARVVVVPIVKLAPWVLPVPTVALLT